jgi:hypothetical protein
MKGFIVIILFTLLFNNCYGDDDEPGSTTYCRTIGKVGNDAKCNEKTDIADYLEDPFYLNVFISTLICSDPNAVKVSTGGCYNLASRELFVGITETPNSITSFALTENQISKSSLQNIASVCRGKKNRDILDSSVSGYQEIYEFDTNTRNAFKKIWDQRPNGSAENNEVTQNRSKELKEKIIPIWTSKLSPGSLIVTVAGYRNSCYSDRGITQTNYYQILKVVE